MSFHSCLPAIRIRPSHNRIIMPTLRVWDFFYKHVTPNGVAVELKGKNQKVRSGAIHRVQQTFWQTSVATRFIASNKRIGKPA